MRIGEPKREMMSYIRQAPPYIEEDDYKMCSYSSHKYFNGKHSHCKIIKMYHTAP